MAFKVIRVWHGKTVIAVIDVHLDGYAISSSGGAEWCGKVDIEIEPFKGLIVDHGATRESNHVHEFPVCSICISIGMEQANNVVTE